MEKDRGVAELLKMIVIPLLGHAPWAILAVWLGDRVDVMPASVTTRFYAAFGVERGGKVAALLLTLPVVPIWGVLLAHILKGLGVVREENE